MTGTYTFIMEYLGGTYISQVKASNNRAAMDNWLADLKIEEIEGFTNEDRESLIKNDFEDEDPILIRGLQNVWNTNVRTKLGYGSIHFIKTDTQ